MSKELNIIRNSLFFDAGYYLERNPDVRPEWTLRSTISFAGV